MGAFIAIEALDGVGKSTLTADLARALGGVAADTPGAGLRNVRQDVLRALGDHQEARCLFYAASVLSEGSKARARADAGEVVVMDRYWLSTLSYARARGVILDLDGVEASVVAPDVTLLIELDEAERVRRLQRRGHLTAADRETLDETFRERVLTEMLSPQRRPDLRPARRVDITNADRSHAVERIIRSLREAGVLV